MAPWPSAGADLFEVDLELERLLRTPLVFGGTHDRGQHTGSVRGAVDLDHAIQRWRLAGGSATPTAAELHRGSDQRRMPSECGRSRLPRPTCQSIVSSSSSLPITCFAACRGVILVLFQVRSKLGHGGQRAIRPSPRPRRGPGAPTRRCCRPQAKAVLSFSTRSPPAPLTGSEIGECGG